MSRSSSIRSAVCKMWHGIERLWLPGTGAVTAGHLTYATPDHPEYRRYALEDLVIVCPEVGS